MTGPQRSFSDACQIGLISTRGCDYRTRDGLALRLTYSREALSLAAMEAVIQNQLVPAVHHVAAPRYGYTADPPLSGTNYSATHKTKTGFSFCINNPDEEAVEIGR